jgi:hypothetical protein
MSIVKAGSASAAQSRQQRRVCTAKRACRKEKKIPGSKEEDEEMTWISDESKL